MFVFCIPPATLIVLPVLLHSTFASPEPLVQRNFEKTETVSFTKPQLESNFSLPIAPLDFNAEPPYKTILLSQLESESVSNIEPSIEPNTESNSETNSESILGSTPTPTSVQPSETDVGTEELFEQVFGHPRSQSQSISVPFFINDQDQGQVIVTIAEGSANRVQASPILNATENILRSDLQEQLTTSVDETGYLSLNVLQQIGIVAVFDPGKLELHLQISPALRRTNVINAFGQPPEAANALPTSHISGYINLRGGEDFVWSGEDTTIGRQPLRLNLDGALNIENWVLEGNVAWAEDADPALTRGDIRLVRDDQVHALRYVTGDFSTPVAGFYQSGIPLLGVSVSRNYTLQPYRVTRPTGEYSFFLERPSTVEVFVNEIKAQQLQLEAGSQDIRNLSLNTGINNIDLIITNDLGQTQRLSFPASVSANLLAQGLQQFSYDLGFPQESDGGTRSYDWQTPTLSLSHRWGISNNLTIGGYLQANPHYQLLGSEGAWASSLGNWGWDVAVSHAEDIGTDLALRLQYEYSQTGATNPTNRTFRVAAEYRGANFTTLADLSPSDYSLDLSAAYSQILFGNVNTDLGGSYRIGRGQSDTYSVNLGISRSFNNGLSGNLNLSYGCIQSDQNEARVFLGLYWLFPKQRQSLSLNTQVSNTDTASTQLTWSISPDRTVQNLGGSATISYDSESYHFSGQLTHTNYRFEAGLTHDLQASEEDSSISNTTQVTFGTAIVFADGHFGWSRPISNSFVLIVPRSNWQGQRIGVNPNDQHYAALVDQFGAAVLPDLQPYYVSQVQLDAPQSPLGYDLGESTYTVLPTYRSGTLIQAGTDATVFIRGTLVDGAGNPVSLQAGTVVSLSDTNWQSLTLFTNRVGRFALPGFKPGQYEIRFSDREPIQFEIPAEQAGLFDLGTLRFSSSP